MPPRAFIFLCQSTVFFNGKYIRQLLRDLALTIFYMFGQDRSYGVDAVNLSCVKTSQFRGSSRNIPPSFLSQTNSDAFVFVLLAYKLAFVTTEKDLMTHELPKKKRNVL